MKWLLCALLWSPLTQASLEDHKGKVVYVDFWASWCAPCMASFPWLNEIQNKYQARRFTVVGINLDKERALAQQFLSKMPASFPMEYDPAGDLAKKYGVVGMPYSIIINEKGEVVHQHAGFDATKKKDYTQAIEDALRKSGH